MFMMDSSQNITSFDTCYNENRVRFSCPQQRNSIPHVFIANMAKTRKKKSEMTSRNGCQALNWLSTFGDSECKKKLTRKIINATWRRIRTRNISTWHHVIPDSNQRIRRNIIQSVISFCLNYHEKKLRQQRFDGTRNDYRKFSSFCFQLEGTSTS